MNRRRIYLWFFFCIFFIFAATFSYAEDTETEEEQISAADVEMDDGTGPDGDLVIPKKMAMRCGISSNDGKDKDKISKCLDTLASENGEDLGDLEQEIMHQLSQNTLEKALTTKSAAGNYEATRDDELEEDNDVQSGSAAAGGEAAADGSDLRTRQEKNIKMSARSSENLLKVIDIYSARVGLDSMEMFFRSDASHRLSNQQEESN